jgi:hypothetical protein
MVPKIIGFVGRAGAGKDSAAVVFSTSHRVVRFAQPIKDACKALYGWCDNAIESRIKDVVDERWGISPRQAMIHMAKNTKHFTTEDFFVKRMLEDWRGDPIVIPDVGYQYEIDAIHSLGGITLKITRPESLKLLEEDHIDALETTHIIENTGTYQQLHLKVLLRAARHEPEQAV